MSSSSTIVLITGANSGVGFATAQVIATTDASPPYHVIMASRNMKNGESACSEIAHGKDLHGTVSPLQLDVTDPSSIAAAVKYIEEKFGRLDVLINNAGIASQATDWKTQLEDTFATNVVGAALVSEAFKPLLLKSKNAYLLHVTSGLGSLGSAADPDNPSYSATFTAYRMSKSALNMLMVQEDKELRSKGVKVFAVCPGLVVSNLRGTGDEQRSAGGRAIDPKISGELVLSIIRGERDEEVGRPVKFEGVHPW